MKCRKIRVWGLAVLLAAGAGPLCGQDWPEWCGQPSRNMAAAGNQRLPEWADCGVKNESGQIDLGSTRNVKWVVKLGHLTTGSPVVSGGKVIVGTTWKDAKEACFLCLDEETGNLLGTFLCPKPPRDNLERWAISSTPTIDGDRLYFVSPHQEVICIDLTRLLAASRPREGDAEPPTTTAERDALQQASLKSILWRYDLLEKLQAYYHHTASSSVLVHGDYVYVCTGNGRSWVPGRIPFSPLTPSLVAFHKRTGQLVARDDEQIGEQLYRGQYSSPALGVVNGQAQILLATGNGRCQAFQAVDPSVPVAPDRWMTTSLRGPIVYYIDVENQDTGGLSAAEYARSVNLLAGLPKPALPLEFRFSWRVPATTPVDTIPTARVPDVPLLKKIWSVDCIPPAYKRACFYPRQIKGDGRGHPCDIIGTPVFCRNRVYVAIGGDTNHGGRDALGNLVCIDATLTGDITETGKLWSYEALNQSVSTVAVADDLVFVADNSYKVHCLDADTGFCHWTYSTRKGATCFSSPVVADGKLFLSKAILSAARQFELHPGIRNDRETVYSSHCVANGVLFAVLGDRLWAICDKAGQDAKSPAAPAAAGPPVAVKRAADSPAAPQPDAAPAPPEDAIKRNWPNLRGPFGQGVAYDVAAPADFDGPTGKNVLWKTAVPRPGASSPVVWEGRVFLTGADETSRELYCFDAADGEILWRQSTPQPTRLPKVTEGVGHAASTGATDGKRFFAVFATGDLVAVDMNGAIAWTRAFGTPKNNYGYASSLIVYKHLFVQIDDSNEANLYALDPATGKTVWQKKRAVRESWASPMIVVSGDREMVVLAENPTATAYDVNTGAVRLSTECLSGEVAPSPAYAGGTIVVANERAQLSAISVATGTLAWRGEDDLPDVASPLATRDFVLTADSYGMVNCYDIRSGRKLWTREFDESFYPSPVFAAGRVYALDNAGTMHVFQASPTFVSVAESKLGEESRATPAFAAGRMFLRGLKHLYCIGTSPPSVAEPKK
ncbi:MAG: PQQ-binding-like beta-propeller repeat protein [Candidatus Anammoximicrobium sp.]|nr:PQQ-binding-like beta-propeller repeat protein [Candidatus Anammoximicrobium sp.]